jgi:hypothetical protein
MKLGLFLLLLLLLTKVSLCEGPLGILCQSISPTLTTPLRKISWTNPYFHSLRLQLNNLLLCSDIQPQPGPSTSSSNSVVSKKPKIVANPCRVCEKGVTKASKAILCNWCEKWTHVRCTPGVSLAQYTQYVSSAGYIDFICDNCSLASLPFSGENDIGGLATAVQGARAAPSASPSPHVSVNLPSSLNFLP